MIMESLVPSAKLPTLCSGLTSSLVSIKPGARSKQRSPGLMWYVLSRPWCGLTRSQRPLMAAMATSPMKRLLSRCRLSPTS